MRTLILTQYPFPYGQAQTNRLISIAKGLSYANDSVSVVVIKPVFKGNYKVSHEGTYEGINYIYPRGRTERGKNVFYRIYSYIISIFKTLQYIYNEDKKQKINSIILGYTSSFMIIIFGLLIKSRHILFLHERSEYPFLSYPNTLSGKFRLYFYMRIAIQFFDGFILITNALIEYFDKFLTGSKPFYKLPILVEPERFDLPKSSDTNEQYIAYIGSMSGDKDGVPSLLKSFSLASKYIPELKLLLIGDTNFKGFEKLKELVATLKIKDKVKFTGLINRNEVAKYLVNARALALSRPSNIQSEGGFPTKLGEYLATGNPVIITNVGEISEYLVDGRNAFIAEPNKDDKFAEKIEKVFFDSEHAKKVGQQGKLIAQKVFNYRVQGIKLTKWIQNLKK